MYSEKDKMIRGDLYRPEDLELSSDRLFAQTQILKINTEVDSKIRNMMIQELFGMADDTTNIEPNIRFDYGYNIHVGKNFFANYNCTLIDVCPIYIGDNCMFAPNVQLYTATHPLDPVKRNSGLEFGKSISIKDNVWIGGGAIILLGVTLGNNVVVGAGSVVTKSFPDNVVVAGNPATVIKILFHEEN